MENAKTFHATLARVSRLEKISDEVIRDRFRLSAASSSFSFRVNKSHDCQKWLLRISKSVSDVQAQIFKISTSVNGAIAYIKIKNILWLF